MTAERSGHEYDLHGRRRGRPLRRGRREALDRLLPEIGIDLAGADRVDPDRLFAAPPREVWLEIGFGGGEHLAWQAAHNPDVGIIGCEPFVNGVASLLSAMRDRELDNVRVLPDDVRPLLDRLAPASIGRVFVLFPDPWPKARHHRRRIVSSPVLDRLAAAMSAGAELRLATDDMGYLRWMLERLSAHPAFEWTARGPEDWRSRPADWPATRYEQKALRQGRRPVYLRFRRSGRGAAGRERA